jgi:DNA-binding transcriptional MerR regulator
MHQIGEVAERVGLSLRTVRYYEEMGLITPQQRTGGGFRLYTDENIERLLLIKQMKPLGFSVQEMRGLLETRDAVRTLPPGDPGRSEAAQELARFAEAADERCRALREHLAAGVELARQLTRESRQDLGA